jgi:glutamate decarboxylase
MPLHDRSTVRRHEPDVAEALFASADLAQALPKYRFPAHETIPELAFQAIKDELLLDGNSRQNLATFCQTWEDPQVHQLMDLAINKNLMDKDEYPQSAEIERRCVHMLADLWNAPDSANTVGASAVGSSEACMLAGLAAKWRWRAKREATGRSTDKPNMVCGPVQVVWHKFARYWDIEMREIPMSPGKYAMDPEQMLARIDENTMLVVPTFGVTYTGAYEPVLALSQALDTLQEEKGYDVDIHVDGASGAFLAPFCAPHVQFDFRIPRVKSISTSGHKFGLAPLGVGWVVWRDKAELPEGLIFHVTYLGGDMPDFQINFSRPAGQIISQYYEFIRLGKVGYQRIHQACYDNGAYLAEEIVKLGPFDLLCDSDPSTGIPTVTWRIKDGVDSGYTLFDLADRLRVRGWQVPAYPLTGSVSNVTVQRVLVRQGVDRDLISILLDDFADSVTHFDKHPVSVAMTPAEAGGFNHL